jgi:hypothetical protein
MISCSVLREIAELAQWRGAADESILAGAELGPLMRIKFSSHRRGYGGDVIVRMEGDASDGPDGARGAASVAGTARSDKRRDHLCAGRLARAMTSERPSDAAATRNDPQGRVLAFLGGEGGKRIDTHASIVFLGEDRVLKVKRAVRLPFLDYSTLEKRKNACEEELRVNAGNAPELYRRVVPIARRDDGVLEIGGSGAPVEWAVEMARFDEERTLDRIAETKTIEPELAASLADAILRSHDKAPRDSGEGWLASVASIIDRNTAKFRSVRGLDAAAIDQLDSISHDRLTAVRTLLGRRAERRGWGGSLIGKTTPRMRPGMWP